MSGETEPARAAALDGVLVADFSRALAGPIAGMFLADLGATVVKVERTGVGDETRQWGPPYVGSLAAYYCSVNRNKRSVELDLANQADRALAQTLARRADVLIENFLPGKLAGFGLDDDALRAHNPRLVYCSITGFGGGSNLPGYDFVIQAASGLMSVTGPAGGEPTKVGAPVADVLTGLHATIGILAALHERERSGLGQRVEVNLLSSMLSSQVNLATGFVNGAPEPGRMGNRHPSITPYETFATGDGPIAIAAANDRQFRDLVTELGRPELGDDPRFATNPERVAHRDELGSILESALRADTAAGWAARLQARNVPCGPVNRMGGAVELAQALGLDPVVRFDTSEGEVATLASPLRLDASPVGYRRPPPPLGADSAEIRAWLADDAGAGLRG
ncbi:MAG TPA: CoA transferase [Mycobacteriales bacterium]|nr:CoA transferase [Mycobacteriales bacterium]